VSKETQEKGAGKTPIEWKEGRYCWRSHGSSVHLLRIKSEKIEWEAFANWRKRRMEKERER